MLSGTLRKSEYESFSAKIQRYAASHTLTAGDHHVEEAGVISIVAAVKISLVQNVHYLLVSVGALIMQLLFMYVPVQRGDQHVARLKVCILHGQHTLHNKTGGASKHRFRKRSVPARHLVWINYSLQLLVAYVTVCDHVILSHS